MHQHGFGVFRDISSARRHKICLPRYLKGQPFYWTFPRQVCHSTRAPIFLRKPRGSPAPAQSRAPQARFGVETKVRDYGTDIICSSRIVDVILMTCCLQWPVRKIETWENGDLAVDFSKQDLGTACYPAGLSIEVMRMILQNAL